MAKAAPLFRQAVAAQKTQIFHIVEENTDFFQDRNEAKVAQQKSSGFFDPTSDSSVSSFQVTFILLAVVVIVGLVWHFGKFRRKERRTQNLLLELKERIPSLRVVEYIKSDGRQTLRNFTSSLLRQIEALKSKNTWFYKAERSRVRLAVTFDTRRSTARVRPEVNAAVTDDKASVVGASSSRQSSLLSFYEFRKKK